MIIDANANVGESLYGPRQTADELPRLMDAAGIDRAVASPLTPPDLDFRWLAHDPEMGAVPLVPHRHLVGRAVGVEGGEDRDDRRRREERVEVGGAERAHAARASVPGAACRDSSRAREAA